MKKPNVIVRTVRIVTVTEKFTTSANMRAISRERLHSKAQRIHTVRLFLLYMSITSSSLLRIPTDGAGFLDSLHPDLAVTGRGCTDYYDITSSRICNGDLE